MVQRLEGPYGDSSGTLVFIREHRLFKSKKAENKLVDMVHEARTEFETELKLKTA